MMTDNENVFGCITEKNGRLFCCIATHFRGCNGIGDLLTRQARNFIYNSASDPMLFTLQKTSERNKFIAYIYICYNQQLDEKSSLRNKIEAVEHYHNIFKNTKCFC